jgi:hypothetical protein
MNTGRSSRPGDDHVHPDAWSKEDHRHFELRVSAELEKLERAVENLTTRVTLMLGGLTLVAVLLPVISPFIRAWLNIDTPPGQ